MTRPTTAFFEGRFVPLAEAKVSIMAHTFNYGTGCFGGLRGYWSDEEEQLFVFRIRDHYRRLLNSAKLLLMDLPYDVDDLVSTTLELLRRQGHEEDCYIRPIAYKADTSINVKLHDMDDDVAIFSVPFGRYIDKEGGADVCLSSWRRVDDNAIPARGKVIGAYVNSALIKSEAMLNGFDEAIVLNQDGHVSEGSAENLFIVRDGRLITPPLTANVLEGITRRTVIELGEAELGIQTVERQIDRSELYAADEAFFCGTGVQITAIARIDCRPVGDGKMGPVTEQIHDLYFDVVRGGVSKYRHWCAPVYMDQPEPTGVT